MLFSAAGLSRWVDNDSMMGWAWLEKHRSKKMPPVDPKVWANGLVGFMSHKQIISYHHAQELGLEYLDI